MEMLCKRHVYMAPSQKYTNRRMNPTRFPTVENAVSSKRSPSKQLRFPQKAEFKRSSFKRSQASNEKSPVMYVTYNCIFYIGKTSRRRGKLKSEQKRLSCGTETVFSLYM